MRSLCGWEEVRCMFSGARSRLRSIAVQLPLSVSIVLLVVVAVFSLAAYREVRRQAVDGTYLRLEVVSERLATTVGQAFRRLATTAQAAADSQPVIAALAGGGADAEAQAHAILGRILGLSPQVLGISLWDTTGRRVLEARRPQTEDAVDWSGSSPLPAGLTEPAVERVDGDGTLTWYDTVGVVRSGDQVLGHVLVSWQVAGSPGASQNLADLVGLDATFALGRPGGRWTDLDGLVAEPPPAAARLGRAEYEQPGSTAKFAVGRQVDETPWQIWVASPRDVALAGPRAFLLRVAGAFGSSVLLLGVVAAAATSRRVTGRLDRLTESADAIADGRYNGEPLVEGEDELGRLARSFNIMARRVWEAQRQLEKRVAQRTAELENANRELEAFTYTASHDLRAPLRAIVGFGDIVSEEYGSALDERGLGYLARNRGAAARMQNLIDALLEFSRTNRHEMAFSVVDLSALAREVVAELSAASPGRRIRWQIADDLVAPGDPRLLGVVMRNLLGNAWKFTAYRESAEIEVGMLAGAQPTFFVRDNGAGFDMQYAERLFTPFHRLHGEQEFQGTGIGLSLVQRIIERHNGRVWADSAAGEGATFYFALPMSSAGAIQSNRRA
jgi:signal transduction histidine kinase